MRPTRLLPCSLALFAGCMATSVQAESYHTCTNIIASLPALISTQGEYCLTKDLATAITSGYAIDIESNNVTIDCNGYKIGGLAAGPGTQTRGIFGAASLQNITIRNCGIRGFRDGIDLTGGAGHLIEDNRLDNNLYKGVYINGDNNLVRRNRVYDTGGLPTATDSYGIDAEADVIDNTVSGVFTAAGPPTPCGIQERGDGTEVRGNKVSGLSAAGGAALGINTNGSSVAIRGNTVTSAAITTSIGINGFGSTDTICSDNDVFKFNIPIFNCQDGGGNVSN